MLPSKRPARTTPNNVSSTNDTSVVQPAQGLDSPQFEAVDLALAMKALMDSAWACFNSLRAMRWTAECRVVTARDLSLSSSFTSVSKVEVVLLEKYPALLGLAMQ